MAKFKPWLAGPTGLFATAVVVFPANSDSRAADIDADIDYGQRDRLGWTVNIHSGLLESQPSETRKAVELLRRQLEEISRVVPASALTDLHKVTPAVGFRTTELTR